MPDIDEDLLAEIKARNLHLKVCRPSNIQVGVLRNYASHPVDLMSRRGLSLSINTDARTVLPLNCRWNTVAFGWQAGEYLAYNLGALRHPFLPEEVKAGLEGG